MLSLFVISLISSDERKYKWNGRNWIKNKKTKRTRRWIRIQKKNQAEEFPYLFPFHLATESASLKLIIKCFSLPLAHSLSDRVFRFCVGFCIISFSQWWRLLYFVSFVWSHFLSASNTSEKVRKCVLDSSDGRKFFEKKKLFIFAPNKVDADGLSIVLQS